MKKQQQFTLPKLPVITSHLCRNSIRNIVKTDKIKRIFLSPADRQVKQYCFTCRQAGEAVLLHLDRTSGCYCNYRRPCGNASAGTEQSKRNQ